MSQGSFEITIIGLLISFGGLGVSLLAIIVKLLSDTLGKLTREMACINRKVNIVANHVGMDLIELDNAAKEA